MKSFQQSLMRSLILLLVASATQVWAAVPYDDKADLLRNGRVVYHTQLEQQDYRVVLSAIRRVNNQWRTVQEETVRGRIERHTFELRTGIDYDSVRQALLADVQRSGSLRTLFQCEGHDCGSSSGWANEFLQIKQLFGLDRYQLYKVLKGLDAQQRDIYLVYYLVQRGNGRVYLQQDAIYPQVAQAASAVSSEVWVERLSAQGYLVVPGLTWDGEQPVLTDASVELLLQVLAQLPNRPFHLVGHDYRPGTTRERQARSAALAQFVAARLQSRNPALRGLQTQGLGHLAPAGRQGEARVELVLD